MRFAILTVLCALWLGGAARADIEKPATLNDTLELLLERTLPTFPNARINQANQNIQLDASGDQVINPDNIHSVLRATDDPSERQDALDNFVAVMMNAMNEPARDTSSLPLHQIYPVLRHQSFAQSGSDSGAGSGAQGLYYEPYLGDMILTYAIDYPDRVAYVTRADLVDADITPDRMNTAAFENLTAKSAIARFEGNGVSFMAIVDGFYESSLVLDNEMWSAVAEQWRDEVVMIVPSRDLLIVAPLRETAEVEFLDSIRADVQANGTHQLSDLMYIWRDGRWQVFEN